MQPKNLHLLKSVGGDSYTKMLLHAEGAEGSTTISDSSMFNKTISAGGNVKITNVASKFGSGAISYNGTTDYIYCNNADFSFGTAPFTVDFWVYVKVYPTGSAKKCLYDALILGGVGARNNAFILEMNSTGKISIFASGAQSAWSAIGIPLNQWVHIAAVREVEGGASQFYINGIWALTDSRVYDVTSGGFVMGRNSDAAANYFSGYQDEIRVSKGVSRWNRSTFAVPTAPYEVDEYTKLLLHCEGANNGTTFTDETGKIVSPVGDAKTVTDDKKFGASSLRVDGSGDYLSIPDSTDWNFGTGDFTVDLWIRPLTYGLVETTFLICNKNGGFHIGRRGTTGTLWGVSQNNVTWVVNASPLPTANEWHHLAYSRKSGVGYLFLDGRAVASAPDTYNYISGAALTIGARLGTTYTNCYMDEIRVSKGIARWTADFTPPAAPY